MIFAFLTLLSSPIGKTGAFIPWPSCLSDPYKYALYPAARQLSALISPGNIWCQRNSKSHSDIVLPKH